MASKRIRVSCIAALGKVTRVIGKDNDLVWRISEDLQTFKKLTTNHPIIMGKKTFLSIGKALPNRENIVITRDTSFTHDGVVVTHSPEEALEYAKTLSTDEIFIIGGAQIYESLLKETDRLYLTLIDDMKEGDTFFPEYSEFTNVISEIQFPEHNPPYSRIVLEK